MNVRRFLALTVFAMLFDGCGGHKSSPPPPPLLTILTNGGSASCSDISGIGNIGGDVSISSVAALKMNGGSPPPAPTLPTAPTTGTELTNALITAGTPIAGNVLVSSTLQIAAGVNPAVITTNSGDVVIRGSLIGERSAGSTTNGISINAPAGTIYVLGLIQSSGTAGTPDNPNGGPIALTAQRIVVLGWLDAGGETRAGSSGGNGGAISLDTTGGGGNDILIEGGVLRSGGGAGTLQGAVGGNGGNAGTVTLQAGALLALFGSVSAEGGAANSYGSNPTGGNGGNVTLRGTSAADISGSVSCCGGAATGLVNGATGGNGGTFTAGSAAPYRIYGLLQTSGGNAAAQAGGPIGGLAGALSIGAGTPVSSLELGQGTYSANGGSGTGWGASAGNVVITSKDGDIPVGSAISARGGDGFVLVDDRGGVGGSVSIKTDADPLGNTSNHFLRMLSGSIDTSGGASGGQAGDVTLQCGGDLDFSGTIVAQGRDHASGGPSNRGRGGAVSLLIDAANTVPSGNLTVQGQILTDGGRFTYMNGKGGPIALKIVKAGGSGAVTVEGTLSSNSTSGYSSVAGDITIQAKTGNVTVSGTMTARAANEVSADIPGTFTISTAGSISFGGMIDVSCGDAPPGNSNVPGGNGGTVSIATSGAAGTITLLPGTVIKADAGGASVASGNAAGGNGGSVLLSTVDQSILVDATISARGGYAVGIAAGGTGGQVVVDSDSDGNGTGGDITLTAASEINVSGGPGVSGGLTLNNGGVAPANSTGSNLAVVLDAAGGRTASPDGGNEGVVQNLGRIIATGGSVAARGGDIWFDGKNVQGANLGPADGGNLTLTGPAGDGVFFPN